MTPSFAEKQAAARAAPVRESVSVSPCGAKQADYKKTYPVPEDQAGRASGILQ